MMRFPRVVMAISISIMLVVTSVTYADTNSFDVSTDYMVGDIVSVEGALQAELLTYTEDSIEIGLFNQEDQVTARLMWDVKAESGEVILNPDAEDEETLPMSVTEQMSPENRVETLANGLFRMATPKAESLSPEEPKLGLDISEEDSVTRKASPAVTTSGSMAPIPSRPAPSPPVYQGADLRDNVTRGLIGRARYNLADGDTRHVWVRLMAYNNQLTRWEVMGWVLANGPNNGFSFVIPELYDLDRIGNDLETAVHYVHYVFPKPNPRFAYIRRFAADAWSAPGKRKNIAWVELHVLGVEIVSLF